MIHTSYFAKMRKMTEKQKECCISIARYMPPGIRMFQYLSVIPTNQIIWRYKKTGDEDTLFFDYTEQLNKLDPKEVAADLEGHILCCYEKSEDFCHRHILADWLNSHGYRCEELEI